MVSKDSEHSVTRTRLVKDFECKTPKNEDLPLGTLLLRLGSEFMELEQALDDLGEVYTEAQKASVLDELVDMTYFIKLIASKVGISDQNMLEYSSFKRHCRENMKRKDKNLELLFGMCLFNNARPSEEERSDGNVCS